MSYMESLVMSGYFGIFWNEKQLWKSFTNLLIDMFGAYHPVSYKKLLGRSMTLQKRSGRTFSGQYSNDVFMLFFGFLLTFLQVF